jgi:hypothetical protein
MGIDATFQKHIRNLPADLRDYAETLPHRLGLAQNAAGRWVDFVSLEPNRELPILIVDELASEETDLPRACLNAFRQAHYLGGCAMLIADRIADRQVRADAKMTAIRKRLVDAWGDVLGRAMDDHASARHMIDLLLADWRAGVALERLMLRRRRSWKAYARSAWLKLRWVSGTACAMLSRLGLLDQAEALADGYTCFLFALQCRDDVSDQQEDVRVRGVSIPEAINLPPGALVRAAPLLSMRAAEILRVAGFPRLGTWMDEYSQQLNGFLPGGEPLQDQLMGMSIAQSYAELEKQVGLR